VSGAAPAGPARSAGLDLRAAMVLVFGIACVSTAAVIFRQAEAPALAKAAWRLIFASAVLLPLALVRSRAALAGLSVADWRRAVLAGAALALHFGLWVPSLDYTSVASSVVLVTTHPFFVGLAAPFVLGERVGRKLATGIGLAFVGTAVVVVGDSGGLSGLAWGGGSAARAIVGDALALGGAVAAAAYFILGRQLRARLPLLPYVAVVYGIAAAILVGAAVAGGASLTGYPPATWGRLVLLALVPQILGHSSFNWALEHLSATFVAGAVLGEPIGGTLLAWWRLGERPPNPALAGGALILAGLAIAARGEAAAGPDGDGRDVAR